MTRASRRITKGGQTLSERVWALIEAAAKEAGVPTPKVMQGSWSSGVSASAGTHSGGGAFDLSVAELDKDQRLALVTQLRRRNADSWLRTPEYGWNTPGEHIHGIVRDEPGLSRGAKSQVKAYDKGLNGLASKLKDPFARPKQSPFQLWGKPAPWPGYRLQIGVKGPAVESLQKALEIAVDGDYGPITAAAVKRYQRLRPTLWPADGIAGPKTYNSILKWGWR